MSEGADVQVDVERSEVRAVLGNRSFRNLLLASGTSSVGDWIGLFALIALANTLGGDPRIGALAVSIVMIARIVPTMFFAPIAGVFVDRWDRKRTMVVTDVVRGTVMLGVAFVGDVFGLVLATFCIEVAAALFIPAKDAVVPTIVRKDRLVQANQLALFSTYATLPLGALLCALLIGATEQVAAMDGLVASFPTATTFLEARPEAVPIILNALSFFVSILFIRRMDVPDDHIAAHAEAEEQSGIIAELKDGLQFIATMPLIRALVVGIMTAFVAAGIVIGVGEFFATILNAGETGFATLGFVVGLGLVLGIVGAGPLAERVAKERLFAPGVGTAGVALIVTALMPNIWLASIPAFVMGLGAGVAFILGYTMLQEYSADEIRGRIFATFNTAVRMALFVALVVGPLAIVVLGVERTARQIAEGQGAIEDIEQLDEEATYPYQIGGVRLTLIASGVIALGGAVWTGQAIAGVLRRREREGRTGPANMTPTAAGDGPPPTDRGLFVVFEGGEGAGKSTQVQRLRATVEALGREVVVTREPGGTPTGEAIREVVLDADGQVTPRAEALLYAAARAEHCAEVLAPTVEQGDVVLCDRYVDSSIVYQGIGRGLGVDDVAELNDWATEGLQPDLTVLLDVPAEVGLARARDVDTPDRLEAAGLEFHERVNEGFRQRARQAPDRYLVLDATLSADELEAQIRERVAPLLGVDPLTAGSVPDGDVPDEDVPDEHVSVAQAPAGERVPGFLELPAEDGGSVSDAPDEPARRNGAGTATRDHDADAPAAGDAPGWLALPDDDTEWSRQ